MLVAGLSQALVDKGLSAGNWISQVAPVVGGGGGGKADLAQAGRKAACKDSSSNRRSKIIDRQDARLRSKASIDEEILNLLFADGQDGVVVELRRNGGKAVS